MKFIKAINERMLEAYKNNETSGDAIKKVLLILPMFFEILSEIIKYLDSRECKVNETRQKRWQSLTEICKAGKLSEEKIIRAMEILREIEKNENSDWMPFLFQKPQES